MEKIILASSSPRRKEILAKYNVDFSIVKSDIEEKTFVGERPEQIAMSLAFQKSFNISKLYPDNIIIGADTIVAYEDEILGKPKDEEDAFRILKLLSGKTHNVITGISIINLNSKIKIVDYENTKVKFRDLDDDKIYKYLKTKEYVDKAGSYGIQGYGALLVEKIEGCYLNVVGLPLVKLDILLGEYFNLNIL